MIKFKITLSSGEVEVWHLPIEINMVEFIKTLFKIKAIAAEIMEVNPGLDWPFAVGPRGKAA